jgi:pilus assembly protein CpaE
MSRATPLKLSVVAVANSPDVQQRLAAQLANLPYVDFHGQVLVDMATTVTWWQTKTPDVVVIDLTGQEIDGNLFVEAITLNPPKPFVVFALHQQLDHQLILNAIRAGAKEFVHYPEDADALTTAFDKVWRQHCLLNQPEGPSEEVMVVYSNKGGMGSSTVALNLAVEYQVGSDRSVCLIDADQQFCNLNGLLNATPSHSLSDLMAINSDRIDDTLLASFINVHESGLSIIYGRHSLKEGELTETLPLKTWQGLLNALRERFSLIIIDLPSHRVDTQHQWLVEHADTVLLISQPDILSLFQTRQYLELVKLHMALDKFKLVVNRIGQKGAYGMSDDALLAQFHYPVFMQLSNDWPGLVEATSLGKPLKLTNPKSPLVKNLAQLSLKLTPQNPQANLASVKTPLLADNKAAPLASPPKSGLKQWLAGIAQKGKGKS